MEPDETNSKKIVGRVWCLKERKVRFNAAGSRNNIYDTGVRNCTPSLLIRKKLFLQPSSHVIFTTKTDEKESS